MKSPANFLGKNRMNLGNVDKAVDKVQKGDQSAKTVTSMPDNQSISVLLANAADGRDKKVKIKIGNKEVLMSLANAKRVAKIIGRISQERVKT